MSCFMVLTHEAYAKLLPSGLRQDAYMSMNASLCLAMSMLEEMKGGGQVDATLHC